MTAPVSELRPEEFASPGAFWFFPQRPAGQTYDVRQAFTLPIHAPLVDPRRARETAVAWCTVVFLLLAFTSWSALEVRPAPANQTVPETVTAAAASCAELASLFGLAAYFGLRAVYASVVATSPSLPLGQAVWFAHCVFVPLALSTYLPFVFAPTTWHVSWLFVHRTASFLTAWVDTLTFRTTLLWPHCVWSLALLAALAPWPGVYPLHLVVFGTVVLYDSFKCGGLYTILRREPEPAQA